MGFAASLHPLSLAAAFRASALRTPARTALAAGGEVLTYADLLRPGGSYASYTARWLAGLMAQPEGDEDRVAASVRDGTLTHREAALRALDNIVVHAAYDRDGTLACTLPPDTCNGVVATTIALWLGGTLHQEPPGELGAVLDGIAAGRFHTWWLGQADARALEKHPVPPAASPKFRMAVLAEQPSAAVRARLEAWLGAQRVREAA